MRNTIIAAALLASPAALSCPAQAQGTGAPAPAKAAAFGDPVTLGNGFSLDPMLDMRLRYEGVDQPTVDADALTVRVRPGVELRHAPSHLSVLVEAEGTVALVKHYNAFPFAVPGSTQRRPAYATVPDAQSADLNRLQLQYHTRQLTVTLGRQRISLDDQRFVGSVAWRQNEQTFDALRVEAGLGPVALDGTYALRQDTIFGSDSGPRRLLDGDFVFLGAGVKAGPVSAKAFSYLIDYSEDFAFANSSQTYGGRAVAAFKPAKGTTLTFTGSFARQAQMGRNPVRYRADYILGEAALGWHGFTATAGWEKLGADAHAAAGAGKAFQTPLATLHKFNGWADLFLTTPAAGLEDSYVSLAKAFPKLKAVQGLTATVVYHRFGSDTGRVAYGDEWDASLGFKTRRVGWLAKYAAYNAARFGVDRQILWLSAEVAF